MTQRIGPTSPTPPSRGPFEDRKIATELSSALESFCNNMIQLIQTKDIDPESKGFREQVSRSIISLHQAAQSSSKASRDDLDETAFIINNVLTSKVLPEGFPKEVTYLEAAEEEHNENGPTSPLGYLMKTAARYPHATQTMVDELLLAIKQLKSI